MCPNSLYYVLTSAKARFIRVELNKAMASFTCVNFWCFHVWWNQRNLSFSSTQRKEHQSKHSLCNSKPYEWVAGHRDHRRYSWCWNNNQKIQADSGSSAHRFEWMFVTGVTPGYPLAWGDPEIFLPKRYRQCPPGCDDQIRDDHKDRTLNISVRPSPTAKRTSDDRDMQTVGSVDLRRPSDGVFPRWFDRARKWSFRMVREDWVRSRGIDHRLLDDDESTARVSWNVTIERSRWILPREMDFSLCEQSVVDHRDGNQSSDNWHFHATFASMSLQRTLCIDHSDRSTD